MIPPGRLVVRQLSDMVAVADADVAAAMRMIREHIRERIGVRDILREVPISRRRLEQRFVKLLGRTPKGEILRLHLREAMNLLAGTDLPIPMVAAQSGFSGPESFATTFRRQTGISPTRYRRKCRLGANHTR